MFTHELVSVLNQVSNDLHRSVFSLNSGFRIQNSAYTGVDFSLKSGFIKILLTPGLTLFIRNISDQRIVIFPVNRNRNRFAEPTSVKIVCEFQNLQIGIGIIFGRWEVFVYNSQITNIFFSLQ